MDHRLELRRSQLELADLVESVTDAQLSLPTPCADWDVAALLDHVVAVQRGDIADFGGVAPPEPAADARAQFRGVAALAWRHLSRDSALTATVRLAGVERPGRVTIAFHFVDALLHRWDLARALSIGVDWDPDLLAAALKLGALLPTGDEERIKLGAFGPVVAVDSAADDDARVLGLFGRDPQWQPG